ncbi:MAG: hypothetical protein Q8O72_17255 [Bacteroidales bacterium]|nr:hypothetical protein [Bacteroidales bacterium]
MDINLSQILIDHSYEYAVDLLDDTGEFYPFAAFTDKAGQVHPLEFEVDKNKMPNNSQVLEALTAWCTNEFKSGGITGFALVFEAAVTLEEGKPSIDTICMDITTTDQSDLPIYYFPYKVNDDGTVTYSEAFAVIRDED